MAPEETVALGLCVTAALTAAVVPILRVISSTGPLGWPTAATSSRAATTAGASRAARPTINHRRCGYDGQLLTHRLVLIWQEHCAQPSHSGDVGPQVSRRPHPAAVHWGAKHEIEEGGHRSSWSTNSQSWPTAQSALAQGEIGPQLAGLNWLVQAPVNGSQVSVVHRRLSLQREVSGEWTHRPPLQASIVQGLLSSQLMSVVVQPRTRSQTGTLQGSLVEQKLLSGWLMHPLLWSQKSSVQSMWSSQSTGV